MSKADPRGAAPWRSLLNGDPLPWLLEADNPSVRYFALTDLLDRSHDDADVTAAKSAINASRPVQAILDAMYPAGYWVKPGPGYGPKYRSTVWSLMFLDQLGADGNDPRVRTACEYVLAHTQAPNGGFGCSGNVNAEHGPNSVVLHCLNGNLLRAMLGFGWGDDARVQRAIEWQARSITGDRFTEYYKSGTTGSGFRCVANGGEPCAWGAIKALRALARIPANRRTSPVKKAIKIGVEFLLSRNPLTADYATPDGRISSSWFKLGFPSGYVADVLQNIEVLIELGHSRMTKLPRRRLKPALDWLISKQDKNGHWKNEFSYSGKLWANFESSPDGTRHRSGSKWVTLRACRVIKAVG
jgi:hypothetical protein